METRRIPNRWAQVALAVILFAAAWLRLWNLNATEFKFDEARVANLAAEMVDTGRIPARGMGSSTGVDNPPVAVYLFALPALVSRDPWVLSAWVGLLNVAAVWGCYRLGRKQWGAATGLLAAAFFAASPWAVFYARKVWAQDLLPPFVVLLISLLYAWVVERRRWALCGALVTLSVLTQIHFAALALIPVVAVAVVAAVVGTVARRVHARKAARKGASIWLPLGVGVALAALLYAPYLIADAREGWRNVRALVQAGGAPAETQWQALRYALLNVGGREIHALAGPERYREFLAGILDLNYWPDRVQEAAVVGSALYLGVCCVRRRKEPRVLARYGLLLLWLVLPALFFLRSSTPVCPHYLIPVYPAPYLAMAIAGGQLASAVWRAGVWRTPRYAPYRRWAAALLAVPLVALLAWQVYLSLSIHAYVDRHDTPGGMGTPIRVLRHVAGRIREQRAAWGGDQAVLLCPGDDPRWDECPAVYGFMLSRAVRLRVADGGGAEGRASVVLPQSESDTLLVVAPGAETAVELLPAFVEPVPELDVPLRPDAGGTPAGLYRFYRLPAGQEPTPVTLAPARLANGVELLGMTFEQAPRPGEATRLLLHWRVLEVPPDPPPQGYSFANHLLAVPGQARIVQADGPGHRVGLWRRGDTVISAFELALPADAPPPPYRLRTGMYVYLPPDQFTTIPVVDAQGAPVGPAVEWAVP